MYLSEEDIDVKKAIEESLRDSQPTKKIKLESKEEPDKHEMPLKLGKEQLSDAELTEDADSSFGHLEDHNYCRAGENDEEEPMEVEEPALPVFVKGEKKKRGAKIQPVAEVKPPRGKKLFKPRTEKEKEDFIYEFLTKGVDAEDLMYLKRGYELMLLDDTQVCYRFKLQILVL